MPIYLSANGRLLADPPTPAALEVVARVGAALALVRPPLPQQPGAAYEAQHPHADRINAWLHTIKGAA